ncbi:MAG TPA: hypothetical protein VFB80_19810, partial [Pirellulaceae bacterium]|nr:hypothetical protein [Pirellulaceae bacterium]
MRVAAGGLTCVLALGFVTALAAEEGASPWTAVVRPGGHANCFVAAESDLPRVDRAGREALLDYPATETTIGAP